MANRIVNIGKTAVQALIVPATSRYADSPLIYYGSFNKMTTTTYKRKETKSSSSDQFTVIRPGYEYRPDLVSQEMYGTPDFWWKILEFNGMKDVLEFKTGVNITLPSDVLF